MSIALNYDISGVERLAERIARLGRADRRGLLDTIGAAAVSHAQERIESTKTSPEGGDWPGWSDRYAAARHGGHSLLFGEGHLDSAVTHAVSGLDAVAVGSNLIYAATHQFGDPSRNIKARPYLGISADNAADLENIMDGFLERALQ